MRRLAVLVEWITIPSPRHFGKPYISRLDLLAPGLPDFLAESSATSGGPPKTFPKYNRMSKIRSPDHNLSPLQRRSKANIFWLGYNRMEVVDENNYPLTTIYYNSGSVIVERTYSRLDPEKDGEKMGTFILDHTAPYAAGFIEKWRSFLLIHALFAVGSRSLETMNMAFVNTLVEMMRRLDMEFDMILNSIANGTIPDLDGIAGVRHHLESNILPDPERAAELRRLGPPSSRPGWCSHVWPNLRSVTCVASGAFASSVPLARWFLGPDVNIHACGYGSTEVWIGSPYDPLELNQFKLSSEDVVEFLDIGESDSITALAQPWEVKQGRRYEVVATTRDGLWRYRLGDVVEITGFDPKDGVPVIQFIERRNAAIRLPDFMVSEKDLRRAVSSVTPDTLLKLVNWTTTIHDQRVPATIAVFVELAGEHVSDLTRTPERVLDELSRLNTNVASAFTNGSFSKPIIWLVRSGTFSDFLQLKLDEGSNNFGQVKVPVVLPKPEYVTWFSNRVVREL